MNEKPDLNRDVLLTMAQAARKVGVSPKLFYRWCVDEERIPAWKRGGRWVVREADLQDLFVPKPKKLKKGEVRHIESSISAKEFLAARGMRIGGPPNKKT